MPDGSIAALPDDVLETFEVSYPWTYKEYAWGETASYEQGNLRAFVQDCDGDFAVWSISRCGVILTEGECREFFDAIRKAEVALAALLAAQPLTPDAAPIPEAITKLFTPFAHAHALKDLGILKIFREACNEAYPGSHIEIHVGKHHPLTGHLVLPDHSFAVIVPSRSPSVVRYPRGRRPWKLPVPIILMLRPAQR